MSEAPESKVIECQESLDISGASRFHEELRDALHHASSIVLDARKVERADAAGLQLLLAFVKEAKVRGVAIHWKDPSLPLRSGAEILGLGGALGLTHPD